MWLVMGSGLGSWGCRPVSAMKAVECLLRSLSAYILMVETNNMALCHPTNVSRDAAETHNLNKCLVALHRSCPVKVA